MNGRALAGCRSLPGFHWRNAMDMMQKMPAPYLSDAHRKAIPLNRFKITGLDHIGIPCRDPELAGKFLEQILGAVEFCRAGYSEEDKKLGRLRHIFYHIGAQLVETVEQEDRKAYPDQTNPEGTNSNPHWAFQASAGDLMNFCVHLQQEGIPFDGPRTHTGISAVPVLFRDVDGNNLEVSTWEALPEKLPPGLKATPMGGDYGFVPWSKLSHNWKPR